MWPFCKLISKKMDKKIPPKSHQRSGCFEGLCRIIARLRCWSLRQHLSLAYSVQAKVSQVKKLMLMIMPCCQRGKNPNGNREFLCFTGTAIWKAVLAMRFQLGAAGKTGDAKVIEKNRK